jgi:hypothetical protein
MIPITVTVSGDTVDIASVEFFDGSTSLGTETTPPFEFAWQAAAGVHELTITAIDTTLADVTSQPRQVTVEAGMEAAGGSGGGDAGGSGGAAGIDEATTDAADSGAGGMDSAPVDVVGDDPAAQGGAGGAQDPVGGLGGTENTSTTAPTVEQPGVDKTPVEDGAASAGVQASAPDDVNAPTEMPTSVPTSSSSAGASTTNSTASPVAPSAKDDGGCVVAPFTRPDHHGGWIALGLLAFTLGTRRRQARVRVVCSASREQS